MSFFDTRGRRRSRRVHEKKKSKQVIPDVDADFRSSIAHTAAVPTYTKSLPGWERHRENRRAKTRRDQGQERKDSTIVPPPPPPPPQKLKSEVSRTSHIAMEEWARGKTTVEANRIVYTAKRLDEGTQSEEQVTQQLFHRHFDTVKAEDQTEQSVEQKAESKADEQAKQEANKKDLETNATLRTQAPPGMKYVKDIGSMIQSFHIVSFPKQQQAQQQRSSSTKGETPSFLQTKKGLATVFGCIGVAGTVASRLLGIGWMKAVSTVYLPVMGIYRRAKRIRKDTDWKTYGKQMAGIVVVEVVPWLCSTYFGTRMAFDGFNLSLFGTAFQMGTSWLGWTAGHLIPQFLTSLAQQGTQQTIQWAAAKWNICIPEQHDPEDTALLRQTAEQQIRDECWDAFYKLGRPFSEYKEAKEAYMKRYSVRLKRWWIGTSPMEKMNHPAVKISTGVMGFLCAGGVANVTGSVLGSLPVVGTGLNWMTQLCMTLFSKTTETIPKTFAAAVSGLGASIAASSLNYAYQQGKMVVNQQLMSGLHSLIKRMSPLLLRIAQQHVLSKPWIEKRLKKWKQRGAQSRVIRYLRSAARLQTVLIFFFQVAWNVLYQNGMFILSSATQKTIESVAGSLKGDWTDVPDGIMYYLTDRVRNNPNMTLNEIFDPTALSNATIYAYAGLAKDNPSYRSRNDPTKMFRPDSVVFDKDGHAIFQIKNKDTATGSGSTSQFRFVYDSRTSQWLTMPVQYQEENGNGTWIPAPNAVESKDNVFTSNTIYGLLDQLAEKQTRQRIEAEEVARVLMKEVPTIETGTITEILQYEAFVKDKLIAGGIYTETEWNTRFRPTSIDHKNNATGPETLAQTLLSLRQDVYNGLKNGQPLSPETIRARCDSWASSVRAQVLKDKGGEQIDSFINELYPPQDLRWFHLVAKSNSIEMKDLLRRLKADHLPSMDAVLHISDQTNDERLKQAKGEVRDKLYEWSMGGKYNSNDELIQSLKDGAFQQVNHLPISWGKWLSSILQTTSEWIGWSKRTNSTLPTAPKLTAVQEEWMRVEHQLGLEWNQAYQTYKNQLGADDQMKLYMYLKWNAQLGQDASGSKPWVTQTDQLNGSQQSWDGHRMQALIDVSNRMIQYMGVSDTSRWTMDQWNTLHNKAKQMTTHDMRSMENTLLRLISFYRQQPTSNQQQSQPSMQSIIQDYVLKGTLPEAFLASGKTQAFSEGGDRPTWKAEPGSTEWYIFLNRLPTSVHPLIHAASPLDERSTVIFSFLCTSGLLEHGNRESSNQADRIASTLLNAPSDLSLEMLLRDCPGWPTDLYVPLDAEVMYMLQVQDGLTLSQSQVIKEQIIAKMSDDVLADVLLDDSPQTKRTNGWKPLYQEYGSLNDIFKIWKSVDSYATEFLLRPPEPNPQTQQQQNQPSNRLSAREWNQAIDRLKQTFGQAVPDSVLQNLTSAATNKVLTQEQIEYLVDVSRLAAGGNISAEDLIYLTFDGDLASKTPEEQTQQWTGFIESSGSILVEWNSFLKEHLPGVDARQLQETFPMTEDGLAYLQARYESYMNKQPHEPSVVTKCLREDLEEMIQSKNANKNADKNAKLNIQDASKWTPERDTRWTYNSQLHRLDAMKERFLSLYPDPDTPPAPMLEMFQLPSVLDSNKEPFQPETNDAYLKTIDQRIQALETIERIYGPSFRMLRTVFAERFPSTPLKMDDLYQSPNPQAAIEWMKEQIRYANEFEVMVQSIAQGNTAVERYYKDRWEYVFSSRSQSSTNKFAWSELTEKRKVVAFHHVLQSFTNHVSKRDEVFHDQQFMEFMVQAALVKDASEIEFVKTVPFEQWSDQQKIQIAGYQLLYDQMMKDLNQSGATKRFETLQDLSNKGRFVPMASPVRSPIELRINGWSLDEVNRYYDSLQRLQSDYVEPLIRSVAPVSLTFDSWANDSRWNNIMDTVYKTRGTSLMDPQQTHMMHDLLDQWAKPFKPPPEWMKRVRFDSIPSSSTVQQAQVFQRRAEILRANLDEFTRFVDTYDDPNLSPVDRAQLILLADPNRDPSMVPPAQDEALGSQVVTKFMDSIRKQVRALAMKQGVAGFCLTSRKEDSERLQAEIRHQRALRQLERDKTNRTLSNDLGWMTEFAELLQYETTPSEQTQQDTLRETMKTYTEASGSALLSSMVDSSSNADEGIGRVWGAGTGVAAGLLKPKVFLSASLGTVKSFAQHTAVKGTLKAARVANSLYGIVGTSDIDNILTGIQLGVDVLSGQLAQDAVALSLGAGGAAIRVAVSTPLHQGLLGLQDTVKEESLSAQRIADLNEMIEEHIHKGQLESALQASIALLVLRLQDAAARPNGYHAQMMKYKADQFEEVMETSESFYHQLSNLWNGGIGILIKRFTGEEPFDTTFAHIPLDDPSRFRRVFGDARVPVFHEETGVTTSEVNPFHTDLERITSLYKSVHPTRTQSITIDDVLFAEKDLLYQGTLQLRNRIHPGARATVWMDRWSTYWKRVFPTYIQWFQRSKTLTEAFSSSVRTTTIAAKARVLNTMKSGLQFLERQQRMVSSWVSAIQSFIPRKAAVIECFRSFYRPALQLFGFRLLFSGSFPLYSLFSSPSDSTFQPSQPSQSTPQPQPSQLSQPSQRSQTQPQTSQSAAQP